MSPVLAQMIDTVAWEPLVIHILVPFSTHPSLVSRAVVIMPPGIGAEIGLGESEAADLLPRREQRKPLLLLLLRPERVDRVHDQRALHRRERADAGVAPLQLLHDQPVGHVVQPGAAVLLGQVCAEESQLRHPGNQLLGKLSLDVGLTDDGDEVLVDPGPNGIPNGPLLLRQQRIEVEEIDPGELGGSGGGSHEVLVGWRWNDSGKDSPPIDPPADEPSYLPRAPKCGPGETWRFGPLPADASPW